MAKDETTKGSPVGRLKRRADFLRVAAARRKWAAPGLILQVSPQPERNPAEPESEFPVRVGFTASRKVGNAVMRNRARRRLKAVVAELVSRNAKPGHDFVLIARTATCDCPFEDLKRDLLQALKRTKALH